MTKYIFGETKFFIFPHCVTLWEYYFVCHSVEIWGFLCCSDFTWNQFWWFQKFKNCLLCNFRGYKSAKIALFRLLKHWKITSCKIWVWHKNPKISSLITNSFCKSLVALDFNCLNFVTIHIGEVVQDHKRLIWKKKKDTKCWFLLNLTAFAEIVFLEFSYQYE